jgi:CHAD domain-containing protein
MADGKWIPDLRPETPLPDAARRGLAVRLETVRDHLGPALTRPDEDIEHVHQLRVGTRRAGAALDIFAPCLPEKVYEDARKHLRRLRRAAGKARDWDVFLADLAAWRSRRREAEQPGLDFLAGYASAQRADAQTSLEEAGADHPFAFDRLLAQTLAAVQRPRAQPTPRTLRDLALPLLSGLLKELDRAAARDLGDYDNLHQVRIAGKRLRYAMEVLAECFAPPFRDELYPRVEEMQDILGRANDSHVAGQLLGTLRNQLRRSAPEDWKRFKPGVEALLRHHRKRVPVERKRFLKWWQRWQEADAEGELPRLLKAPEPVASASR